MKKFYFVRHGESVSNAKKVYQDGTAPLSEKGTLQAEKIAQRAKELPIQHIIASSFLRAHQTAEIISKETGHSVELSDLLVERKIPTSAIGKSFEDAETKKIQEAIYQGYADADFRYEDAETFTEIKQRITQSLDFLHNQSHDEILVVSHGLFIKFIVSYILFKENFTGDLILNMRNMHMENTGITVICFDETKPPERQWYLWIWNDHAHLG